ncbi:DUF5710 domain-containing protein [Actinomycetospora sp. C-140]
MVREQQPWLDVPFAEKDDAKAAGARWDWRARRWYAPRPGVPELARWLPASRTPADGVPAAGAADGPVAGAARPATEPGGSATEPAGSAAEPAEPAEPAETAETAETAEPPTGTSESDESSAPVIRPEAARTARPAAFQAGAGHPRTAPAQARLAEALRRLTEPGRWERLTRRRPPWRVLHGVPASPRRDLDHVLVGPPGVVTVEVLHLAGAVSVEDDRLTVDGEVVDVVPRARAEAERVGRLLAVARDGGGVPPVTAALAVVAASVAVAPGRERPQGVLVATPANLPRRITGLPTELADDEIDELYAVARRLGTWTRDL